MLNVIRIYLPDPKYVAAAKAKASKNICFQLDILNLDTWTLWYQKQVHTERYFGVYVTLFILLSVYLWANQWLFRKQLIAIKKLVSGNFGNMMESPSSMVNNSKKFTSGFQRNDRGVVHILCWRCPSKFWASWVTFFSLGVFSTEDWSKILIIFIKTSQNYVKFMAIFVSLTPVQKSREKRKEGWKSEWSYPI